MQLLAARYYPDFTRKIYIKGYRYNLHLAKRAMLVEVGAQNNTLTEAKNAMEPLSELLYRLLGGEKAYVSTEYREGFTDKFFFRKGFDKPYTLCFNYIINR